MIGLIFLIILLQITCLFLIAILNAKIEGRKNYKGILRSVVFPIFSAGGKSFLLNPIPYHFKIEEHNKIRNLINQRLILCIVFWINLMFIIVFSLKVKS
jgi:hypothetical protein